MGKGGRSKFNTLYHARGKLTDDDIQHLGLGQESTEYQEVDISQNQLTARGLKTVVKFCCRCPNLRIFKAYKNDIDDVGAYQLAKLLERCPYMEELHLSHNCLTAKGVRIIIQAADQNRHRSMSPLWLRLEQNHVSNAYEFLRLLVAEYSVCGRGDERSCTSRHCAWKRKVHVPFLYMQREDWKDTAPTKYSKYWQHDEYNEQWEEEEWHEETPWKARSSQSASLASYPPPVKWRPSLERLPIPEKPGEFIGPVQELFQQQAEQEENWVDRHWERVEQKAAERKAVERKAVEQKMPQEAVPEAAPETVVAETKVPEEPDEPLELCESKPEDEGLLKKLVDELKATSAKLAGEATSAKLADVQQSPDEAEVPAPIKLEPQLPVVEERSNVPEAPEAEADVRSGRKTRRSQKKKNKMSKASTDSPEEGRSRSESMTSESLETASTLGSLDSKRVSETSESAFSSAASSAGSSAGGPKRELEEEDRDAVEPLRGEGLPEGWGSMNGSMMKLLPFAEIPQQEEMTVRLDRALEAQKLMVSAEDKQKVKECLAKLEATIKEDLEPEQQWTVEIFGSMRTGFGTKGCDLDVVIVRANAQDRESNVQSILMKLRDQLEATPDVKIKNIILSARVPILKLEYSGRDVDISVNNTKALMNSRLLAAYAALDPMIPQFGVAVKLWAKDAELCGAPNGHLSSYAFILMALYFLQVASGDELPCLQDGLSDSDLEDDEKIQKRIDEIKASGWTMRSSNLWILLAGFFAFYGGSLGPTYQYEPFNWGHEVISIRLGMTSRDLPLDHELLSELKGRTEGHIHIEDPVDHSRNLRDVLWLHPRNHEKQLREEISWMDQLCREQVRQQIICQNLRSQWPHMASMAGFPAQFPDFPPPFPLPQAVPWSGGFPGPSLKGKSGRMRGGKFGKRQLGRVS